ncbi:MAG: restriction endonuclease [Chloroflexi bacterium]|nr:restriction endonuclease [Chloroflexota bacterium]MBP8060036.1 restriction endonuclease [Chloroflexota bacterium]
MAIPDFQSLMLPVLQLAGDQREHSLQEAIESLAKRFNLSDAERKELLPSGRQTIFDNRIGWARTYLKKALLLYSPRRSYFQISERGLAVLKQAPPSINIKFLQQFPEFVEFKDKSNKSVGSLTEEASEESLQSPGEEFELAYQRIRLALATELLQTIKTCSPMFFERLVVDLLVKMGYGGTRKDAGQAIGKSGDGGIDGIIKEDRLGLDIVYIQAKRWDETMIGRPEIQKFAGALQGQRAKKGIFITTSKFTQSAHDYASFIDSKIVLIDGEALAQLMIDYNVGVNVVATYELKRMDSDYFAEE